MGRVSLVRCHQARCPFAAAPAGVSPAGKTSVGLGMIAFIAAMSAIAATAAKQQGGTVDSVIPRPTSSAVATAAPRPVTLGGGGSRPVWLDKLLTAPGKRQEEQAPMVLPPDLSRPDPAAATRVQSFRCDGALSPSRALICTHWDLATTDYNLSLLYAEALERSRDPRLLRHERAVWLVELDRIAAERELIMRHYEAFRTRIVTI